jgi:hypothetical protein
VGKFKADKLLEDNIVTELSQDDPKEWEAICFMRPDYGAFDDGWLESNSNILKHA